MIQKNEKLFKQKTN